MEKIIEVCNLKKTYGSIEAVKGLDFYVERGKLFSFLGPNGAGKSTTIDIICTFLKQDMGTVLVDGYTLGKDDDKIRKIIGVVFQDGLLDDLLTIQTNLIIRGWSYGLKGKPLKKIVFDIAEICGITDLLNRPYGKLSGGQRRRCDIARALIHSPQILFLDEPTTGLDPQTRRNIWETLYKIQKNNNMTVFLTTHYMEEAAESDYIIVIDDGEISAQGTPLKLKEDYSSDKLILFSEDLPNTSAFLNTHQIRHICNSHYLEIKVPSTFDALPIIQLCKKYLTGFEVEKGTLEDAFISITGKEIRT